jgi:O-acetyl-ADP-ribose deacetylase (regulator of RNase III)
MIEVKIIIGNLLDQKVDVIVNPWNRNMIPWWLLLPQGVSGAIKRCAGTAPFKELSKYGCLALGDAVLTGAGHLPFKGIIHVAGINMFWKATEQSIQKSVNNAMVIVKEHNFSSIAFPLIGTGTGSFKRNKAIEIMSGQLKQFDCNAKVSIVKFG